MKHNTFLIILILSCGAYLFFTSIRSNQASKKDVNQSVQFVEVSEQFDLSIKNNKKINKQNTSLQKGAIQGLNSFQQIENEYQDLNNTEIKKKLFEINKLITNKKNKNYIDFKKDELFWYQNLIRQKVVLSKMALKRKFEMLGYDKL